jgi:hypothetical protein
LISAKRSIEVAIDRETVCSVQALFHLAAINGIVERAHRGVSMRRRDVRRVIVVGRVSGRVSIA